MISVMEQYSFLNVPLSILINNKISVIQAEGIKFNSIIMVHDIHIQDKFGYIRQQ